MHNDGEALKERNNSTLIFRTFSALFKIFLGTQGRRASRCSALAPWLSYYAPSALGLA